jgi:hypothetical protein
MSRFALYTRRVATGLTMAVVVIMLVADNYLTDHPNVLATLQHQPWYRTMNNPALTVSALLLLVIITVIGEVRIARQAKKNRLQFEQRLEEDERYWNSLPE